MRQKEPERKFIQPTLVGRSTQSSPRQSPAAGDLQHPGSTLCCQRWEDALEHPVPQSLPEVGAALCRLPLLGQGRVPLSWSSFWAWYAEDALEKEKGRGCACIPASSNLGLLESEAILPGVKKSYSQPEFPTPKQRAQGLGPRALHPGSREHRSSSDHPKRLFCASSCKARCGQTKNRCGKSGGTEVSLNPKSRGSSVCPASEETGRQFALTTPP